MFWEAKLRDWQGDWLDLQISRQRAFATDIDTAAEMPSNVIYR
jgi:hypothetical protein